MGACLLLIIAGCRARATPLPMEPTPLVAGTVAQPAVRLTLEWSISLEGDVPKVAIASFDPVEHRATYGLGDALIQAEWSPMDLHPVGEMRVCFSTSAACQPTGEWMPFTLRMGHEVISQDDDGGFLHVAAEFRDREGRSVPGFVVPERLVFIVRSQLDVAE
jgi:hypothetical protein